MLPYKNGAKRQINSSISNIKEIRFGQGRMASIHQHLLLTGVHIWQYLGDRDPVSAASDTNLPYLSSSLTKCALMALECRSFICSAADIEIPGFLMELLKS